MFLPGNSTISVGFIWNITGAIHLLMYLNVLLYKKEITTLLSIFPTHLPLRNQVHMQQEVSGKVFQESD